MLECLRHPQEHKNRAWGTFADTKPCGGHLCGHETVRGPPMRTRIRTCAGTKPRTGHELETAPEAVVLSEISR